MTDRPRSRRRRQSPAVAIYAAPVEHLRPIIEATDCGRRERLVIAIDGIAFASLANLRRAVEPVLRALIDEAGARDKGRRPAVVDPSPDDSEALRLWHEGLNARQIASLRAQRKGDHDPDHPEDAEVKRAQRGVERASRHISDLTVRRPKRRA